MNPESGSSLVRWGYLLLYGKGRRVVKGGSRLDSPNLV